MKYFKYFCFVSFSPSFIFLFSTFALALHLRRAQTNWIYQIASTAAAVLTLAEAAQQLWQRKHATNAPWANTKSWTTSLTSWKRTVCCRRQAWQCHQLRRRNSTWIICHRWPTTCSCRSYDSVSSNGGTCCVWLMRSYGNLQRVQEALQKRVAALGTSW